MSLKNIAVNLGSVATNKASSMVHNLDELQKQSLILASLVLVISRIAVAKSSSDKAKGTPAAPYRYSESVRTYIREVCGWTFGFVVLRQLQKGIQWGLGKGLKIKTPHNPKEFSIFKALKEVRETGKFTPFKTEFMHDATPIVEPTNTTLRQWVLKLKPGLQANSPEAQTFLRNIYKHAPIGLASIPTVILAGAYLERGTRKYSDSVANFFSKPGKPNPLAKPGLTGINGVNGSAANPAINPTLNNAQIMANCPTPLYNNARFSGVASPWAMPPAYGSMLYPRGYA